MKVLVFAVLGILFLGGSWIMLSTSQAEESKDRLLRHVVLFTFKEGATQAQIDAVVEGFRQLPKQINGIVDFEWGKNNSPEGLTKGHTHCFLVTFKNEKDRDAYLPHPAHQAFVVELKKILEDVTVIDYWAAE